MTDREPKSIKVFLSYAHEDRAVADALRKHLICYPDVDVWMDTTSLAATDGASKDWETALLGALEQAEAFIGVLTADYIQSGRYGHREFLAACDSASVRELVLARGSAVDVQDLRHGGKQQVPIRGWIRDGKGALDDSIACDAAREAVAHIRSRVPQSVSPTQLGEEPDKEARRRAAWRRFRDRLETRLTTLLRGDEIWLGALARCLSLPEESTASGVARALLGRPADEAVAAVYESYLEATREPQGAMSRGAARDSALRTLAAILPICGDEEGRLYVATHWSDAAAVPRDASGQILDPDVESIAFVEVGFAKLEHRDAAFRARPDPSIRKGDPGLRGRRHLGHLEMPDDGFDADGSSFIARFEEHVQASDWNLPDRRSRRDDFERHLRDELEVELSGTRPSRFYVTIERPDASAPRHGFETNLVTLLNKYDGCLRVGYLRPRGKSPWLDHERRAVRQLLQIVSTPG